jgi:hypothetical protein
MAITNHTVLRPDDLKFNVYAIFDNILQKYSVDEIKEILFIISLEIQFNPNTRLDLLIDEVIKKWDDSIHPVTKKTESSIYERWIRRCKDE